MSKNDPANGNLIEERQSCNQTMKQAQGGCQSKVWISSGMAASFIPGRNTGCKIPITDTSDKSTCYVWQRIGSAKGTYLHYRCSECVKLAKRNSNWSLTNDVPTITILTEDGLDWIACLAEGAPDQRFHFCEPKNKHEIHGLTESRKIRDNIAKVERAMDRS
uniref:Uncharacterized protein n=1 Tax=Ditylenchus dipsaci TaxID=166011 RepID=A0A915CQ06_9BILA